MRTNFRCLTLPSVHSLNLPESTVYASLGTVQFLQKSFSFMVLKATLGSNLKPSRSPPLLRFLLLVTQFPVMCVFVSHRRGVNHCESCSSSPVQQWRLRGEKGNQSIHGFLFGWQWSRPVCRNSNCDAAIYELCMSGDVMASSVFCT